VRDHLAYVIEKVANLWASKLDGKVTPVVAE